METMLRF